MLDDKTAQELKRLLEKYSQAPEIKDIFSPEAISGHRIVVRQRRGKQQDAKQTLFVKCLFAIGEDIFIGGDRSSVSVFEILQGELQFLGLTSLSRKQYSAAIAISEEGNERWILLPAQTIINAALLGVNNFTLNQCQWQGILTGRIEVDTRDRQANAVKQKPFLANRYHPVFDPNSLFTRFVTDYTNYDFSLDNFGLVPLPIPLMNYPFYQSNYFLVDNFYNPNLGIRPTLECDVAGTVKTSNYSEPSKGLGADLIYSCPNDIDYEYSIVGDNYLETHTVTGTNSYSYSNTARNNTWWITDIDLNSVGSREYNTTRNWTKKIKTVYNGEILEGDLVESSVTSHLYNHNYHFQGVVVYSTIGKSPRNDSVDSWGGFVRRYGTHPVSYEREHQDVFIKITDSYQEEWTYIDNYQVAFDISIEATNLTYYIIVSSPIYGQPAIITYLHTVIYNITRNLVENLPNLLLGNGSQALYFQSFKTSIYELNYSHTYNNRDRGYGLFSNYTLGIKHSHSWTESNYTEVSMYPYYTFNYFLNSNITRNLEVSDHTPPDGIISNITFVDENDSLTVINNHSFFFYTEQINGTSGSFTIAVLIQRVGYHQYLHYPNFTSQNLKFTASIPLYELPEVNTINSSSSYVYDNIWDNLNESDIVLVQKEDNKIVMYEGELTAHTITDWWEPVYYGIRNAATVTVNITSRKIVKFSICDIFPDLDINTQAIVYSKNNCLNLIRYGLEIEESKAKINLRKDKGKYYIYVSSAIADPSKSNSTHWVESFRLVDNKFVRDKLIKTTQLKLNNTVDIYENVVF